ncbi:MAG: Flp pilus assembly complex ATPase component TadA [Deltaproteobacteria bacterium]|nr:Flp pilus assembly complex ATPase component TadA [Deltaproteobacteria bacterium]
MKVEIKVQNIEPGKEGAAQNLIFEKPEIILGRNAGNDIVIADPRVSGSHARITIKGEQFFCVDLDSSNGSYLEDQRLLPRQEYPWPNNKRLVIGGCVVTAKFLSLRAEEPAPNLDTGRTMFQQEVKAVSPNAYEKEIAVKRIIHEHLIERLDLKRKDIAHLSDDELRSRAQQVIEQILVDIRWHIPEGLDRQRLIKHVLDEALGLGPLEELLATEDCSEIMVNRFDQIYAEFNGKIKLTDYRFTSEQAVLAAIERILAPIGRRVDEASPLVDARLKDGSRVNAVIRPLAMNGPCITIRKFRKSPLQISDLVRHGSLSQGMADFLKLAVANRLNLVISGGTGSGKTTLLNTISSFIPEDQRIITVEDAAELRLPQAHVISFETRPPNLEGKGAVTIRDLVRNCLRMRPDRIIVGECRGAEALDMLQAMNTGHDGSMTTGHANAPGDMIRRLETMVLTSGLDLPVRAIREQIASAVDLIVQQTRFADGSRKITAITEVIGMDYDEGTVLLQDIFVYRQTGYDEAGKVIGQHQATGYVPKFFRALQERGMSIDASMFAPSGN